MGFSLDETCCVSSCVVLRRVAALNFIFPALTTPLSAQAFLGYDVPETTASSYLKVPIVLMRQPKQNKLSTPYNPKPFVVEEKKGLMVTVRNGSQTITRNSSQFKVVPKHLMNGQHESGRKGVSDTSVV